MLRDLFQHQAYADAAIINAIGRHETAAADRELRTLLHHILVAHRFWIRLCQGLPFSADEEGDLPDSLEPIAARYRDTHAEEREWLAQLSETDLAQALESAYFPSRRIAVGEALMQVCLHSHAHRSQCATRLRTLGGEPPPLDFILWLKDRPGPVWG
ncbi:MAG TPA: DinB family protein [Bryobacteraceae bacterium]|nr:DinB family protein [Bryobacteraceae bacterium]